MAYEVVNGTVGKTGTVLCVTLKKSFTDNQNILYKAPIRKIFRQGFMITVFKGIDDVKMAKLISAIDEVLMGE